MRCLPLLIAPLLLQACAALPAEVRRAEAVYQVLAAIDASQTLRIADHPTVYGENNPMLGSHPTPRRVVLLFTVGAVAHLGVTTLLVRYAPPWAVHAWQWSGIALELGCVTDNGVHGITPTLSFTVHP